MNKKTIAVQVLSFNPFTFNVFINNFFDNWYDLVDRLYVQIDTTSESCLKNFPEVVKFFYDVCKNDPKIVIREYPHKLHEFKYTKIQFNNERVGLDYHGSVMRSFLDECEEDVILFTHDDCFILDKQVLQNAINSIVTDKKDFVFISNGGISPKDYAGKLYRDRFPEIYNQIYGVEEYDNMIGISSCFFMAKKADLLNTNCWYDMKIFKNGEISDVFPDTILKHDIFLDVIVYVLYQLFNKKINRVNSINIEDNIILYNLFGFDIDGEFTKKASLFKKLGLIHFTSSSFVQTIIGKYLENNRFILELDESSIYNNIAYMERLIFDYLSILNFFDFKEYSYMSNYRDVYVPAFRFLISDYNEYIINFNFSDERFKSSELVNKNQTPYQINIDNIPYRRINEIINIKNYRSSPLI